MDGGDSCDKHFFGDPKKIAEIINVMYGGGRTLVRPEDVKLLKTEYNMVWRDRNGRLLSRRRTRDVMCEFSGIDLGGNRFASRLGLECQRRQTSMMPQRCAEYDLMDYSDQARASGENGRLVPTYTMVVNTSGRQWKKPTSLASLYRERPDFFGGHSLSYDMLLFDLFDIPDELKGKFCTDLKYVIHCIDLMKDSARLLDYVVDGLPRDLPQATAFFIQRIIGMEVPEGCDVTKNEGETEMCYAVRVWKKQQWNAGRLEGIEEGRIEGIEEGRIEGREKGRIEGREEGKMEEREENKQYVFKTALDMGLPQESIKRLLRISDDEYKRLLAL